MKVAKRGRPDRTDSVIAIAGGTATSAVAAHEADATDAHDASAIGFTPAGTIAATDVQAAIEEVASESLTNPMTAVDDIIVGGTVTGGIAAPDRLGKGSDGDVLTVDPSTHHLVWAAPAGGGTLDDLTDVTITTPSDGDALVYDSGSSIWINSPPTGVSDIVDIPTAETDTDLRLAPDGAGGVEWAAGGIGSGGLELLEQHTANNTGATLDFASFISSTYDTYLIEIVGLLVATDGASLLVEMGTGAGPTWDTTAGHYAWNVINSNVGSSTMAAAGSTSDTAIHIFNVGLSNAIPVNLDLTLYSPEDTSYSKTIQGTGQVSYTPGPLFFTLVQTGVYAQTTAVTGLRFIASTGNLASGTIRIYGMAK